MANEGRPDYSELYSVLEHLGDALNELSEAIEKSESSSGSKKSGNSEESVLKSLFPKSSKKLGIFDKIFNMDGAKLNKKLEKLFDKFVPKLFGPKRARDLKDKITGANVGEAFNKPFLNSMLGIAPVVVAATTTIKLFSKAVERATSASMEYRKAVNANRAALNEASAGSVAYIDAKKKEAELINKILNNSGLDAFSNLAQQLKNGVLGVLSYNWAEKLNNKLFGQKYSENETVAKMYGEMTGLGGYTEASVGNAISTLLSPMVTSGMGYDESKDLATALAYAAMGYSKKYDTGEEGFANSVESIAQGMSSGSMYDIATGVRLDEDIMTGYAMKNGRVLPQYASDSVLMRERSAYITDAYITAYTGGAKAASDFSKELKKTGEVMNDIQETLFSFDEVIQLSAKVYEDVEGKVVESIDKSWTQNIEGDTVYHEQGNYQIVVEPTPVTVNPNINVPNVDVNVNVHIDDNRVSVEDLRQKYGINDNNDNITYDVNDDGNVTLDEYKERTGRTDDKPITDFYTAYSAYIYSGGRHIADGFSKWEFDYFTKNQKLPSGYDENGYSTKSNIKPNGSGVGPTYAYDTVMGSGGIALDDTSALIGEAGKEAVIPLESYSGVDYLASAMTEAAASAGGYIGGDTVNVTLNGTILEMNDYNVRRLGQKLAAVIENNKRRNGGV